MGYGFGLGGRAEGRVVGGFYCRNVMCRREKCFEGCCGCEVGFFGG